MQILHDCEIMTKNLIHTAFAVKQVMLFVFWIAQFHGSVNYKLKLHCPQWKLNMLH
jgi:hypothetical protein